MHFNTLRNDSSNKCSTGRKIVPYKTIGGSVRLEIVEIIELAALPVRPEVRVVLALLVHAGNRSGLGAQKDLGNTVTCFRVISLFQKINHFIASHLAIGEKEADEIASLGDEAEYLFLAP